MFDIEANMNDLMIILIDKYKKYTLNDHSSISIEKAQQLMNSILYCINGYINSVDKNDSSLVSSEYNNAAALYEKGLDLEKRNLSSAKKLFNIVKNNALKIDNLAYIDTIFNGLNVFFERYDVLYAAHETPGSIDYQLALEIRELTGVEYILTYLNQLYYENSFCSNFPSKEITALLRGYSYDYKDLLVNIFEIILQNALGLELLGENFFLISIDGGQRQSLYNKLVLLSIFEIQEELLTALNNVFKRLEIEDTKYKQYIRKAALTISYEIKRGVDANRLEKVFVTSNHSKAIEETSYIDGQMMSGSELRLLIEKLKNCKKIDDKISLIKESVHSIEDLIDILDTCIWKGEYKKVFELFNEVEKDYISKKISLEILAGINAEDLTDWQREFIKYTDIENNYYWL